MLQRGVNGIEKGGEGREEGSSFVAADELMSNPLDQARDSSGKQWKKVNKLQQFSS